MTLASVHIVTYRYIVEPGHPWDTMGMGEAGEAGEASEGQDLGREANKSTTGPPEGKRSFANASGVTKLLANLDLSLDWLIESQQISALKRVG